MALPIQYDLFESNDEISLLRKEIEALREQNANVRKGLFARHAELAKLWLKQQDEIDQLKCSMKKEPDLWVSSHQSKQIVMLK